MDLRRIHMAEVSSRDQHSLHVALRAAHIARLDPEIVLRAGIINKAVEQIEHLQIYYDGTGIPERILHKLEAVKSESDLVKLLPIAEKAVGSMLIHMLALWSRGVIRGHPQEG